MNTKQIFQELKKIINNAYAPYSKFKVAAMVETNKGCFFGVNIENSSYSLTICAERVAIFNAITHGVKKINALYLLTNSSSMDVVPCGSCLQVMSEFCNKHTKVIVFNNIGKFKTHTLRALLPHSFILDK